jgi:two-component system phosphate regulon response regulator OmpR
MGSRSPDRDVNILLIDDSRFFRGKLVGQLRETGWPVVVTEAGSLSEIDGLLERELFQLIILDGQLGDGNAVEFIEVVKDAHPRTPVAMVSWNAAGQYRIAAARAGADYFFSKSDEIRKLLELVGRLQAAESGSPEA